MLPHVTVALGDIARSLLVIMLLPLGLGLLGRTRYPQIASWSTELHRVSGSSITIGLAAGLLAGWQDLIATVGSWIFVAAILLTLGAIAIGWLFAALATPQIHRVVALSAALRNFSAALLVASRDFGRETLVMTMAATIALSVILIVTAGEMGRREGHGRSISGSPSSPTSRFHSS